MLHTFTYSLFISFLHLAEYQYGQTLFLPYTYSMCIHPFPTANSVCALTPVYRQNDIHAAISLCLRLHKRE